MYSRVVESLKILVLSAVTVASIVMPLMLTKINILFDADFGVMVADKPDISAKVVEAIEAKLVLRVLTTCNTDPAGNPVVVADVRMVPVASGRVSVLFVLLFGLSIVKMPVPLALGASFICDIIYSLAGH